MRRLLLLLLVLLATPTFAASPLWGNLEPGPYTPGLLQLERYDHSRMFRMSRDLDGKPRTGERARPIRITVWYPAEKNNAKPLTFGDYVDMAAGEARFGALTADELRAGENAIFGLGLLGRMTPEQRAKVKPLPSMAVRDAKPAAGKFPLILYSLGSTAPAHVTPEYLASHGYVVMQSPRLGAVSGFPPDSRDGADLETKLRDMDFLLNEARHLPQADLASLASIGFSAGGRWALAAAMKYPDLRAVVSLDSVMLYEKDAVFGAWKQMPHFSLDAVRVPVLHMVRKAFAEQETGKMWEQLRYADRTYVLFENEKLDHFDFQSAGLMTALAGLRGDDAPAVAQAFAAFNRWTLAFLDTHVKGVRTPMPAVPEGVKVTRLAAEPAPFSDAEFLNAIAEDGTERAISAYRTAWKTRGTPPVSETSLNVAGYTLLFSGRPQEGIALLALNAEAHPASANVYDSLADAYLAIGDRAKALELTNRAAELLDKDPWINEERRALIRRNIELKRGQLK